MPTAAAAAAAVPRVRCASSPPAWTFVTRVWSGPGDFLGLEPTVPDLFLA
ncbi:hypothetical protein CAOG_009713 [Capsaspora owczarzaki ATCC 30864]|uniref:Uncharacterized protein n=1 Tax=Capsaspora owczarzaki (strain ATCC 30864) TaxID=595528 RepID=A0A0D2WNV4_CAPO3|nr:hypothetical protein CAOG_009713 [Capsaspora owczarzaki ATCC 30864]